MEVYITILLTDKVWEEYNLVGIITLVEISLLSKLRKRTLENVYICDRHGLNSFLNLMLLCFLDHANVSLVKGKLGPFPN